MLHIVILIPFLWAALVPLMRVLPRIHPGWAALPVPAALFAYLISRLPQIGTGEAQAVTVPWMPGLGIDLSLVLDGWSLLFALLITGIGTLVVWYSMFYMGKNSDSIRNFYVYLLLFMGAMLGVVLSDNLMVLYAFWELTSVASFLLIAFWYRRERSRYGALKSMLITVFGGLAMFAGFNLLYAMTGTYSIREIAAQAAGLTDQPLFLPAMILVLLGAFTKSAQFPFHIWLPDAMEAPTPVSAYLHSATMVKAGLYLVARMSPIFAGGAEWFWIVSLTGLITLLYGSYKAIRQTDLKALLAYSTISQLGLIMSLLGVGSAVSFFTEPEQIALFGLATSAAVFHLINHAVFKGSLFMVVGIVDHETGTRDLRRLGGLMRLMPVTFVIALIGAFSMAGMPPFSGFLSKEMFFTAMVNIRDFDVISADSWLLVLPVIAWVASVFTFVYSMILVFKTFGGKIKSGQLDKPPHEASAGLLAAPVLLVSLALVFALIPNGLAHALIDPAVAAIHGEGVDAETVHVSIHFWHGWTPELFMTLGVVLLGVLLYRTYTRFRLLDREWSGRDTLNRLYNGALSLLENGGRRATDLYMTGSVRRYLIYILLFLVAALGGTLIFSPGVKLGMDDYAPITFYEVALVAVMLAAAAAVPFARSRVNAILFTGAAGYMVTALFLIFRAPDLALTQMIVETVSVILFLLCFKFLPKLKREKEKPAFKWTNLIVAAGVGVTVTLVALAAMGSSPFEPISAYFLNESYEQAGGKNVVNVILVDFRGFDTLFEIMVLGVASLGIYGLVKLGVKTTPANKKGSESSSLRQGFPLVSNDVILRTMSRVIVLIIISFSLYLFFAGHNNPGGGFIAALMTASALILLAVSYGMDTIRRVIRVNYRLLTAVGLAIAILTAAGSFVFGAPFLSQTFDHFHLPILGDTELATAVLFDLGVYLAVVGVVMNIIFTIKGED
ncbi:Na+/H+ antiporter subunit A [Saccharibacillus alkalitolerans]|uniref:Na+/H+ antiporter subunit A n=1 Tax=Saccharibacillus alkalitolerans TaxID=2705290 RepID=A0ABX0FC03_9BACL|nr:Na+/H+ antiporter subunit A [Saccharibacillus alkalitolerans]NGZ76781.1 Na+/H+ antiporter subunit A [Saccharibacillus alkalitolerans]